MALDYQEIKKKINRLITYIELRVSRKVVKDRFLYNADKLSSNKAF